MSDETSRNTSNSNAAEDHDTIEGKLTALHNSRLAIIDAIQNKGVNDITDKTILSDIPTYINSIIIDSGPTRYGELISLSYGESLQGSKGSFPATQSGVLYCMYKVQSSYVTSSWGQANPFYGNVQINITITPSNSSSSVSVLEYDHSGDKSTNGLATFNKGDVINWNVQPFDHDTEAYEIYVTHKIEYAYEI